jgi:hypothetical protein
MHATSPMIVYTIPVSIEFIPNHNSCKVNSSLCTKKDYLQLALALELRQHYLNFSLHLHLNMLKNSRIK